MDRQSSNVTYQVVPILEEILDPQFERVHAKLLGQVIHDALNNVVTLRENLAKYRRMWSVIWYLKYQLIHLWENTVRYCSTNLHRCKFINWSKTNNIDHLWVMGDCFLYRVFRENKNLIRKRQHWSILINSISRCFGTWVVPGPLVNVFGAASVMTACGMMFQAAALYAFCE